MNKELIVSGIIGLILAWAVFEVNIYASIFAGIMGIFSLYGGLKNN